MLYYLFMLYMHASTQQKSCSYSTQYVGATMTGTVSIKSGSEGDLMNALTTMGPISVAVDARSHGFRVNSLRAV